MERIGGGRPTSSSPPRSTSLPRGPEPHPHIANLAAIDGAHTGRRRLSLDGGGALHRDWIDLHRPVLLFWTPQLRRSRVISAASRLRRRRSNTRGSSPPSNPARHGRRRRPPGSQQAEARGSGEAQGAVQGGHQAEQDLRRPCRQGRAAARHRQGQAGRRQGNVGVEEDEEEAQLQP